MAIIRVQAQSNGNNAPSLYATPNTAGNLLIACVRGATGLTNISDTNNNNWQVAIVRGNGSNGIIIYYVSNCKGGANTVTYTGGSGDGFTMAEYSGITTSSPVAQTNSQVFSASGGYGPLPVTTTLANTLIIGAISNETADGQTDAPTGGFTDRANGHGNVFMADRIVSSTGTYTYGGTYNFNTAIAAAVAVFKSAPTDGGGSGSWMQAFRGFINKKGLN